MNTFVYPAPPNFKSERFVDGDDYNIASRLYEFDPNLFIEISSLTGKYEIWVTSERMKNPYLLYVCEEPETGAFRPLDERCLHIMRQLKLGENEREPYDRVVKRREEWQYEQDRREQELFDELREDVQTMRQVLAVNKFRSYGYRPTTRAKSKLPQDGLGQR